MARIQSNRTYVSQATLRRFVDRVSVVAAHHAHDPAMTLAATPAVHAGENFARKFDARAYAEVRRATVKQGSLKDAAAVASVLRVWLPLLAGRLSFDPSVFTPASSRPADVVFSTTRLLTFVDEQAGAALPPEAMVALAELRSAVEIARAKSAEAQAGRIEVQARAQEARNAATTFHETLMVLRRVALNALGRSHLDYQALRYGRVEEGRVEIVDGATSTESDRESGEFAAARSEAS
jgi:hypothetical protein